jgi:hypothetical protein
MVVGSVLPHKIEGSNRRNRVFSAAKDRCAAFTQPASRTIWSPTCVELASAAPAGSSSALRAPNTTDDNRHGFKRGLILITVSPRPRKTMSIAKRMKNMCIHMKGVNRPDSNSIPVPSSRPSRPSNPRPWPARPPAFSSRAHSTVPRVLLNALIVEAAGALDCPIALLCNKIGSDSCDIFRYFST